MLIFKNFTFYIILTLAKFYRPVIATAKILFPNNELESSVMNYNHTAFARESMNLTKHSITITNAYKNWPVLSLSVFSLFGIFGNMLVLKTIRRDHSLQTSVNLYLFSLAIADFAVCLIVIPFSLIQDFTGNN